MKLDTKTRLMITLGLIGYMVYISRQNGGTLAGNPQGYKVKLDGDLMLDMAVPFLIPNPVMAAAIKHGAKNKLKPMAGRFGIHMT